MQKASVNAVCILLVFGCATIEAQELGNVPVREYREDALDDFVRSVKAAIAADNVPVRIYYRGECDPMGGPHATVPFPLFDLSTAPTGNAATARLNSMFQGADFVRIFEENSGVIRIVVNEPRDEILQTSIGVLEYSMDEKYTPELAIRAINRTPEVLEAADSLRLRQTLPPMFATINPPLDSAPRLPDVIRELVVDDALDMVAVTFHRTITFGVCSTQYMLRDSGSSKLED